MKSVEIEQTARLTESEYKSLKRYLAKNFKKIDTKERFMIRFFEKKLTIKKSADIRYK